MADKHEFVASADQGQSEHLYSQILGCTSKPVNFEANSPSQNNWYCLNLPLTDRGLYVRAPAATMSVCEKGGSYIQRIVV